MNPPSGSRKTNPKQTQSNPVLSAACPERSRMGRMGQFPKSQNERKIACQKIWPHPNKEHITVFLPSISNPIYLSMMDFERM